ncbi:MAG TPA: amino acid adenylation domain-containing protein [Thermoanaerobaculia bacterium]|nr:amino acid adenylation domain-containing protein [Thermoanaerobaculia bacterium]
MRQAREVVLGAQSHQELPFELLVEQLGPERSLLHAPLFQVLLSLDNTPGGRLRMPGLEVRGVKAGSGTAKFDLILTLRPDGDRLDGDLEFRRDLFDRGTAERLAAHFGTLLAAAVAEPERRTGELPMLAPAERRQLLDEWGAAPRAYPREASIVSLFAEQARQRPESWAVEAGGRRLSYGELDRRSTALARELRRRGLRRGERVWLCAERSLDLVVALLAVLKAGGAYVPLDPTYPRERLELMLADCGVELVLCEPRLRPALPAGTRRLLPLALDETAPAATASGAAPDAVPEAAGAGDLAYVVYTSGSTGRPKGVAVPHRGVVRLVRGSEFAALGSGEVFLLLAPLSFDATTLELWGPLLNGGSLVVPPPGNLSLAQLGEVIARSGVTTLFLTTGLFHLVVDEQLAALRPLRQLMTGGDVLQPAQMARVRRELPHLRLVAAYGPTENTTYTTCHVMAEGPTTVAAAASVPIGRPIANTSVAVLSRWLEPVPVGVAGELYAGGDGLAWGYVGRPDLTAERFVPDPFGTAGPGSRLYRTGDLALWRPPGVLEFLGRRDAQVKVRGFRIELAEIEAALAAQPGVRAAAVTAPRDASGNRRLIGYVVPAGPAGAAAELPAADAAALRRELRSRLPDYMVPGTFVALAALPLTAHGKLDRQALPLPAGDAPAADADAGAPRTLLEELLAGIWAEVLEVPRVGIDEDFFALGGHSLRATQVVSRVRRALGMELPLRELFAAPTVAALASRLEGLRAGAGAAAADPQEDAPLVPQARPPHPPLSFAQQRLWFIDQLEPGNAAYNIPVPLRLEGTLAVAALARALAEIVRRHEVLRTTFEVWDETPWQRVHAAAAPGAGQAPGPWMVDLEAVPAEAREAEARRLVRAEARRPFDLARGPLLRAGLLRLGERDHLLLATLHHIAGDGWSLGVLTRELGALYRAYAAGRPSPLPELPIQYADFALWQRRRLRGAGLAGELSYWRRQLAGAPAVIDLPTDRPRPPLRDPRGATVERVLGPALSAAVAALARQAGATPFVTLLTVFQVLLARLGGQADVSVGTPIAGRTRVETEGLIGFFVNTLVLRARLAAEAGTLALTRRGLEVALAAHAHQAVPFERLVEDLEPRRSLAYTPLFQALFTLQNAPGRPLELPGLTLRSPAPGSGAAKFDLMLGVTQGAVHGGPGFTASLEVRADLFDAATARRLLGHYETLLAAAAAEPERPWLQLPLLLPAERAQLLGEWGEGADLGRCDAAAAAGGPCLHQLFARQAALRPDALALAVLAPAAAVPAPMDDRLTYAELQARVERLAARLRRLGVGPEVRVAVCLEREPALVVTLLAVLAAGGAYVPLDPAWPAARAAVVLADARPAVLVTRTGLLARLPAAPAAAVLTLDEAPIAVPAPAGGADRLGGEPPAPGPDNLAYVIFTSGSTGRPKGVAIPHRAAVARVAWARAVYRPADLAGVLAATSVCFDLSVFELFVTLGLGGTVILARDALQLAEPAAAAAAAGPEPTGPKPNGPEPNVPEPNGPAAAGSPPVTLLNTVPSAMAELVRLGAVPPSVRVVNLAGEPLPGELVDRLAALGTVERVYNLYGPSEDTTYSTGFLAARGARDPGDAANPPAREPAIGRPLAGTRAYVADRCGEPAPVGVAGELLLGGVGQARGYLGRPELTAERFVPDPLSGRPGERLYRTGDLARWRADGELQFLGRFDHQVKVRGFRIELGEIEAALRAQPGVREAVVVARGEPAADAGHARHADDGAEPAPAAAARLPQPLQRLVAYVVPDPETLDGAAAGTLAAELRRGLGERLPDYMVPGAIVLLAALPLTPSGKVDRRALPDPAAAESPALAGSAPPLPPRDELELALLGVWEEVLGSGRRIGVRDGFFELGGHSLLAVRLVSRVRRRLGAELPLASLFADGTIERQAALLRRGAGPRPAPPARALVEVRSGGAALPFVCVHPVGGSVLCYVELARGLDAATPGGRPFWGLQAPPEVPPGSVEEMAERYLAELAAALPAGPYLLGGWSMGALVAFEMARRLLLAGREVARLVLIDPPPAAAAPAVPAAPGALLAWFARDLAGLSAEAAAAAAAELERGAAAGEDLGAAIERLCEWARRQGTLPADVEAPLVGRLFERFRANAAAAARYRPAPYGGGLELLLAAAPGADRADGAGEGARGWDAVAALGARVQGVPGGHYGLLREPTAGAWAAALARALGPGDGQAFGGEAAGTAEAAGTSDAADAAAAAGTSDAAGAAVAASSTVAAGTAGAATAGGPAA